MESMWPWILLIAAVGLLYFAVSYIRLKWEFQKRVLNEKTLAAEHAQRQLEIWREREIQGIRERESELATEKATSEFQQWITDSEKGIRKDAIKKSQAVTFGKVTENLIPFRSEFSYNPKDARFIGSPIDFIVFDGLSTGLVEKVIFVEVKTGKSTLSTRERRVRDAIRSGSVEWIELRFAPDDSDEGGELSEAIDEANHLSIYESAMESDLQDSETWYGIGELLYDDKRYRESLHAYNKAIESDPDCSDAWYDIACIHSLEGRREDALKSLAKAVKLEPEVKEEAREDADFLLLRGDKDFQALTS